MKIFSNILVFFSFTLFLFPFSISATTYSTSAVTQITTATTAGANDQEVLRVSITTGGGGATVSICYLQFTMQNTNDADISNAKLYSTNTTSTFTSPTLIATIPNPTGTITFNNVAGLGNGTFYFWLAYDIKPTAPNCNSFDAYVPVNGLSYKNAGGGTCPGTANATPTTSDPTGSRKIATAGCWTYCTAGGSSAATSYLKNVTLNDPEINQSNTAWGGYRDYYSSSLSNLSPSLTYSLDVTILNSTTSTKNVSAWIDFDNNGTFDASDKVLDGSSTVGSAQDVTITQNFSVPGTAVLNYTRMRVEMEITSATGPCNQDILTDVQDYRILICPGISSQPANTAVCSSGGTATFSVTATGTSLTYQWQEYISSWNNISNGGVYSGATSTSLTITNPPIGMNGYKYRCNITSTAVCGTLATDGLATLTVLSAPSITAPPPSSTTICQGSSAVLSLTAAPASSTYQWQYSANGSSGWANVANGTPANFSYSGSTTASLTVSTTTSAATGTYYFRCRVTDCAFTVTSSNGNLTVNALPSAGTVSSSPSSGTIDCGTGAGFSTTITLAGGYTGTIQWQSSSDNTTWYDIQDATASTYSTTISTTTYFRTVQTLNGCTKTQSATALVTVTNTTNNTWLTTGTTAWGTSTNWSASVVPGICHDVTIPSGGTQPTISAAANCHNLTINSGAILTNSVGISTYLNVYGNLINNGTITQTTLANNRGITLNGQGTTWGGTSNLYNSVTIKIQDNSNIFLVSVATISTIVLNKTSTAGKINLGSSTLKITNEFSQSGNILHVNTGLLWLAPTSGMTMDLTTLEPDYGTVFWDLTGGWIISGNWENVGSLGGFYNLRIKNTGSTTNLQSNQRTRNNFTVESGTGSVIFDGATAYTLRCEGNFINNDNDGTPFSAGLSTVIMDGTNAQNIQGTAITTFNNLTINNTSANGVSLQQDANVTNTLTLTNAPLNLNSKKLTVTNSAITAIARTSGYVVSETNTATNPSILQWNIGATTGNHIYPFGSTDGYYIPVTFNNNGNNSGNTSISTRRTSTNDNTPWATGVTNMSGGGTNITTVVDRWWEITPTSAVSSNITLSYIGTENTTTATGNMGIQIWTGSIWNDGKGGASGTYSGSSAPVTGGVVGTVAVTGITEFSPFVVVRVTAPLGNSITTNLPLPVPLCRGENITVDYTITGTYNAGNIFTVQLSDATGSFATPTNIGNVTSTTNDPIAATIPTEQAMGTLYRIRVISSNPSITGNDNGSNLTVQGNCTFYWVGGAGNWNDASHWSLSSGGAGGVGIPNIHINVYIDDNSGTSSTIPISMPGPAAWYTKQFNMTGTNGKKTPIIGQGSLLPRPNSAD